MRYATGRRSGRLLVLGFAAVLAGAAAMLMPALPARASQAEARSVALAANCKPGKIEPLRQIVGGVGETVFRVSCTGGKNKDAFVLVQCRVHQCVLLR